jgi:hypothetical protein
VPFAIIRNSAKIAMTRFMKLAFLTYFLALILCVNFLHVEKGFSEETNCPACQFQRSSLGTILVAVVVLLPLVVVSRVELPESRPYESRYNPETVSRAPPVV